MGVLNLDGRNMVVVYYSSRKAVRKMTPPLVHIIKCSHINDLWDFWGDTIIGNTGYFDCFNIWINNKSSFFITSIIPVTYEFFLSLIFPKVHQFITCWYSSTYELLELKAQALRVNSFNHLLIAIPYSFSHTEDKSS